MSLLSRMGVALALAGCAALTSSALAQKSHQYDVDTVTNIPAGQPGSTSGIAGPYPSSITVSGINAPIGDVKVVLHGLTHTFVADLDILLVGPTGQTVAILDRLGGYNPGVTNAEYTFTQDALPFPPQATIAPSGRYRPSQNGVMPNLAAPAPAGPYGTSLATFKGRSANGTWSLYIVDQAGIDSGTLAGWSLIISEAPSFANERAVAIPAVGIGNPYPSTAIVDGLGGTVQSVQVMLSGLSHTYQSDLRFMLQGPTGATCMLYANCGDSTDWVNADIVFDDNAASNIALGFVPMAPGTYKPTICTNYQFSPASLAAPAPASPYGTTLSVFNGTPPKGTWKLWVEDSVGGDSGNLARGWALIINGQVCPADFNKSGGLEVQDIFDFLSAWFAGCP